MCKVVKMLGTESAPQTIGKEITVDKLILDTMLPTTYNSPHVKIHKHLQIINPVQGPEALTPDFSLQHL